MTVYVLCGSARFRPLFQDLNVKLSLQGHVVLDLVPCPQGTEWSKREREILKAVHFAKIGLADKVLVINQEGYIGESTALEIEYAKQHGKEIVYLQEGHP